MNTPNWTRKYKQGRSMISFDFEGFLKREKLTIEQLATALHCSIPGAEAMAKRGTIKGTLLDLLNEKYTDLKQFIKE